MSPTKHTLSLYFGMRDVMSWTEERRLSPDYVSSSSRKRLENGKNPFLLNLAPWRWNASRKNLLLRKFGKRVPFSVSSLRWRTHQWRHVVVARNFASNMWHHGALLEWGIFRLIFSRQNSQRWKLRGCFSGRGIFIALLRNKPRIFQSFSEIPRVLLLSNSIAEASLTKSKDQEKASTHMPTHPFMGFGAYTEPTYWVLHYWIFPRNGHSKYYI